VHREFFRLGQTVPHLHEVFGAFNTHPVYFDDDVTSAKVHILKSRIPGKKPCKAETYECSIRSHGLCNDSLQKPTGTFAKNCVHHRA